MEVRLEESDEIQQELEQADLSLMDYSKRGGRYPMSLKKADLSEHRELLTRLIKTAYENSIS